MSIERLDGEIEYLRDCNNKLRNEIIREESTKRVNDDYIKMLEEMVQTFKNQRNYQMQMNEKLEQQNKRYREALEEIKGATSHNKYWKYIAHKALESESE